MTTDKGTELRAIAFQIPEYGYFAFTAGFLRHSLRLPARRKNQSWAPEPTKDQITDFLDAIGYAWEDPVNKSVGSKMKNRRLNARWQYIFTQVIQCLSSKIGSNDQASKSLQDMAFALCTNYSLNFAEYIFSDMYNRIVAEKREKTMAYPRFFATIFENAFENYHKQGNHSFSTVGKKSLEIEAALDGPLYTPYMLSLIRSATVSIPLENPTVSIPDTTTPAKRKPGTGYQKSIAHKAPYKKQKKDASQQVPLSTKGVIPTPPQTSTTTTTHAVAA